MAKASKKPLCIVIAGTNGAGKTTFARESARAQIRRSGSQIHADGQLP